MLAGDAFSKDLRGALLEGGDAWVQARENLRKDPTALHRCELPEADLSGRDLTDLDFTGADFYKADLTRANIKKSNLSGAELSLAQMKTAALYKVDLTGAILQESNLTGADLSETSCEGADFRGADLTGANLSKASLRRCNFSHCDLSGVDLSGADITGAILHFAQLSNANVTHLKYGSIHDLVDCYYGVRGIENTYGNALFARDAKDQDYLDTLYRAIQDLPPGPVKSIELGLFRAWGLIDHGRSLLKVAAYAFVIAMFYGLLYTMDMVYGWGIMDYSRSAQTWFTPFYYSVVTYTTLGFGDVTADSLLGELLVISEVIVGYFTLGLLLAILANTIARRS